MTIDVPTAARPQDPPENEQRPGLRSWVLSLLPAAGFKRSTVALAGGAGLAQFAQAIGTPLLSRMYSPAVFGVWSLIQSAAFIPTAAAGLRYEVGIVLSDTDEEAANVAALQTLCVMIVAALTLAFILAFRARVASLLGIPNVRGWLIVVPFIVLLNGLTVCASYWMTRFRRFGTLASFRIAQSGGGVLGQAGLGVLAGTSASSFIAGGVLGLLCPFAISWPTVAREHGALLRRAVSFARIRDAALKFRNFPLYVVPYGFVSVIRERGILMLLAALTSTEVVGLYAIALRLAWVPVQLLATAMSPVVFRRASEFPVRADAGAFVSRALLHLAAVGTPAFVFIAWYARDAFPVLLGPAWKNAGVYASLLAMPASFHFISGPLDRFFDLAHKQRVALILESSYTVVALAVFAIGLVHFQNVLATIMLSASVTSIYHATWVTAVFRCCRFPMAGLRAIAFRFAVLSGSSAALFWFFGRLNGSLASIGCSSAALATYYAVLLLKYRASRA